MTALAAQLTPEQQVGERFARDTVDHKVTILRDDGLYRHLRATAPNSSAYWFELITVPNALIFRGDGESFVFTRIEDMFAFFRSASGWNPPGRINASYWAEKLTTSPEAIVEYREELFTEQVAEALKDAEERHPGVTKAWAAATDGYLPDLYTSTEEEARDALERFEYQPATTTCSCGETGQHRSDDEAMVWRITHRSKHRDHIGHQVTTTVAEPFRFTDTCEWNFRGYSWWYLWACHAIVWGIAQYDAARAGAGQPPAEAATRLVANTPDISTWEVRNV